jgi:pilus assembly protein FimV
MASDAALQPESLGFDLDLAEIAEAPLASQRAEPSNLGFHDLDLDLDPVAVEADAPEFEASTSPRWQEMSTKLDLALAYDEIGDKEGARELLQEVITGGDVGQQQKARVLLSKIG